jgi:hypothetical protein
MVTVSNDELGIGTVAHQQDGRQHFAIMNFGAVALYMRITYAQR